MIQFKSILCFVILFGLKNVSLAENTRNKLIVVMLDGCRHDYFSRNETNHPGFQHFKNQGVVAEYVQPIYPSSSFESWTSISTGLYPNKIYQVTRGSRHCLNNVFHNFRENDPECIVPVMTWHFV